MDPAHQRCRRRSRRSHRRVSSSSPSISNLILVSSFLLIFGVLDLSKATSSSSSSSSSSVTSSSSPSSNVGGGDSHNNKNAEKSTKSSSLLTNYLAGKKEKKRAESSSSSSSSASSEDEEETGVSLPIESVKLRPRVIHLNIMVAGLSGLGKTTTCASLIESWQQQQPDHHPATLSSSLSSSSSIPSKTTVVIDESRVYERYDPAANTILRVRIIDTPGFGNRVNHKNSVTPIVNYIQKCRRQQLKQEMSPHSSNNNHNNNNNRHPNMERHQDQDKSVLVHVCLYFLFPGRFLEIDKHFLKLIQKEVSIIPIIAKADTMTDEEISAYRSELYSLFQKEKINIYNVDQHDTDTDKDTTGQDDGGSSSSNRSHHHAATIKASGLQRMENKIESHRVAAPATSLPLRRGRQCNELLAIISRDGNYPWGNAKAFHSHHSDLLVIRNLLLSSHTETFIALANTSYQKYRSKRIRDTNFGHHLRYVSLAWLVVRNVLQKIESNGNGIEIDNELYHKVRSFFFPSFHTLHLRTICLLWKHKKGRSRKHSISAEEQEEKEEEETKSDNAHNEDQNIFDHKYLSKGQQRTQQQQVKQPSYWLFGTPHYVKEEQEQPPE